MKQVLEVSNLYKDYGRLRAVDGVSFSVAEGEIFGLLGPNGAGKTTILGMICGLLRPDSGAVTVGGWQMGRDKNKAKALIGLVPQEPALHPKLSARANLEFFGVINGLEGGRLKKAVADALQLAGLEDRANERVERFSGGMKRRLNIAIGTVHSPRLLIMDEPTVGVDPQSRNHILECVKMLKEHGTSVIYTSHYVEEVEYLCDRVAVMDGGKIITEGAVHALLKQAGEFEEIMVMLNRPAAHVSQVQTLPGVWETHFADRQLQILTSNAERVLPMAFAAITGEGFQVSEIHLRKPSLESLFLKLTGRALRD